MIIRKYQETDFVSVAELIGEFHVSIAYHSETPTLLISSSDIEFSRNQGRRSAYAVSSTLLVA